ncbi:flagellar motor protein MotB [Bacillus canaveralius]|uniref:Flagellar motor protein MotB n=1 Tax=Bacillus canaveralius TaxID=1403243 RepID=A0A2N5GJL6_9BACI|nr:flagellar motor protein MotB [Bacillus canaveralius]PLR81349.1 flagellar motor protein MotB [Bacillus canaveralius]PLR94913.1 flagellar motor protein MotB [Bacillus canaveralius]RSK50651.1 flagellar motor protein MotB [Bacillus canaveralius]
MSKRKKRHLHEDHMDESWLIPYSDLLTLLLALFIVLFAMSSVDAKKFEALSKTFNEVFNGGTGVMEFESQSPVPEGRMDAAEESEKDQQKKKQQEEDKSSAADNLDQQELEEILRKVNAYIEANNLTEVLQASLTDEGLLVSIRDNVFFSSGSSDVRAEDRQIANEIAALLVMDPPRNIIISGHTDNIPIQNSQFSSNWELSVMRAVNFMKIVLENKQLDPRWFSAKGFGEFQPVAPNDSDDGRAKNRRVEILILPRNAG